MSKKFYAVNRETGEKWKPQIRQKETMFTSGDNTKEFLMMYDSGYLAVVTEGFYTFIEPLDPKIWKAVIKDTLKTR